MMTMEQRNELFAKLPKELREEYGFHEPFDYSKYECIHKDGFDYYPELHCIIVNDIVVWWQTEKDDLCEVDIDNPEHVNELLSRVKPRFSPSLVGIIYKNTKGRLMWLLQYHKPKDTLHKIPVDGTYVYYNPDDIDIENNNDMKLLAECMFIAVRYGVVEVFPYKNQKPEFWGCSL